MSNNLCISLYDRTGNWSKPYREAGWSVVEVDIQRGQDVLKWQYRELRDLGYGKIVILAAQPCTAYANSGNRFKKKRLENGEFEYSQRLVDKTHEIIDYFNPFSWALENPKSDIHKKNPWIGQRPVHIFNPCDYAGYDPVPENSQYNKETWLFGKFNQPVKKYLAPLQKDNPGWKNLGGKSLETKNARSVTPLGFSYAFFEANH